MQHNNISHKIFVFIFALLACIPLRTHAASQPVFAKNGVKFSPNSITAHAAIVVDTKTGAVLFEKNADAPRVGASITKLMTSLVYASLNQKLSTKVQLTSDDEVGGGRLRVGVGTILTVKDLIYCSIVGSANNTATAMMHSSGLSNAEFLRRMNAKAAALGMTKTHYVDPSGMDPKNITSARDVSRLAQTAFGTAIIQKAAQTADYHFYTISPAIDKHVKNTNALLLNSNNGLWILAGKTGYLEESQYNLTIRVQTMKKEKDIIVVVLGADTKAHSFSEAEKLAKWSWNNYVWTR